MKSHSNSPDDLGAALAALAAHVDRLDTALAAQSALAEQVNAQGQALASIAQTLATPDSAEPEPDEEPEEDVLGWAWISPMTPAMAVATLARCTSWVTDVWQVYTPIAQCWAWHPPVVAEILACQLSWEATFTPTAGPDALSAWHDRWRPAAQTRITERLAACTKTPGVHVANGSRWHINTEIGDELAYWWATERATPAPGLTPADAR